MATFAAVIPSQLSADQTFSYLALFSNASSWDPGVVSAVQLDPGAVGSGTRFRLTVRLAGVPVQLTYKITKYDPPREVVLTARHWLLTSVDRITVSPDDGTAHVSYHATVTLPWLLRPLDRLLAAGFAKVGARAAAGLSAALSATAERQQP